MLVLLDCVKYLHILVLYEELFLVIFTTQLLSSFLLYGHISEATTIPLPAYVSAP